MSHTIEELEKALETLKKADALGGHDSGGPMTVREALDVVFRATPEQLCKAGFEYMEPPEEEEER